jgi:hypothetical protein
MRLQRQISRKVEGREYGKYVVVIRPEDIEALGWREGQELMPEVKGKKLVISLKESQR